MQERTNILTETRVEMLETVGEARDDHQEVSNTQKYHQVVEDISHCPAIVKLKLAARIIHF